MNDDGIRIYEGATAIITGGASGIGRAIAEELGAMGCEVVVTDLQTKLAKEVAEGIKAKGGKATSARLDVTDYTAVDKLVRKTVKRTGRLDYMFNNAGVSVLGAAMRYEIDDWDLLININLKGVINGVHAAYRVMLAQGFGHIVNTASITGLITSPGLVGYSATKHAVVGLSKSLRAEAAIFGVKVSAFCPGLVNTSISGLKSKYGRSRLGLTDEQLERYENIQNRMKAMDANLFARKSLSQLAKNRALIIVPSSYKLIWLIGRIAPSLEMRLAQNRFVKRIKRILAG